MTRYTQHLRLILADNLDSTAQYNLQRIDQLGASGLFDSTSVLTLRSTSDITLRPGEGSGGSFLCNHQLTNFSINTVTFTLNDDVVFAGNFSLPWARVSKTGASVTDFSDFTTQVQADARVTTAFNHTSNTSNPHGVTAAQVGAYTTAQTDTLLATKAATVHSHTSADVTDFNAAVASSTTASSLSSHTADSSIHFTEASIDHTAIQNVGTYTHAQIDTHITNNNNPHNVTATQLGVYTESEVDDLFTDHNVTSGVHGVVGNFVGTSDTQALTNKTIDASLNTLSNISNGAISVTAAIAGTKISPNFGNQVINTLDGITFEEGGWKAKLRAAQSGMDADVTWELPPEDGTSGQVLSTNGSGVLDWASVLTSALAENNIFIGNNTDVLEAVDTAVLGDIAASTVTGLTIKAGAIVNADVNAAAAIALSKLATVTGDRILVSTAGGVISPSTVTTTTLGYLDASSSIQTQLDGKQPLDADLTAVAGLGTTGLVTRTAAGTMTTRAITGGTGITVNNGDGVAAAPEVVCTITQYTDEMAQDAVGGILTDSSKIDFTYNDGANTITATIVADSLVNADINSAAAIALSKLATVTADRVLISSAGGVITPSTVTTTTLGYLDATSSIQTQLNTIRDNAGTWVKTNWAAADGATKQIVHNLGSRDITVTIYDNNTYETIFVDSEVRTDPNTLDLTASVAPSGAGWRVLIRKI